MPPVTLLTECPEDGCVTTISVSVDTTTLRIHAGMLTSKGLKPLSLVLMAEARRLTLSAISEIPTARALPLSNGWEPSLSSHGNAGTVTATNQKENMNQNMNQDWNCTFGGLLLRLVWLAIVVGLILVVTGCDDASSRKLQDNTVLPSERAGQINYGKP